MKKKVTKTISIALCVTMLQLTTIYVIPAFAAGNSDSQQNSNSTGTYQKYVPSILQKVRSVPEDHAYIPANTKIALENTKTIDSKTAHVNDPVKFRTLTNLIVNGVVVIPAGTIASGVITEARSAGGFGRSGKLAFSINSIETLNNVKIPLAYDSAKAGQTDGGAVAVFVLASMLGGFLMKGTNCQCVEGTKVEATVTEDTDLNVTFDQLGEAMNASKPHGVNIILKQ